MEKTILNMPLTQYAIPLMLQCDTETFYTMYSALMESDIDCAVEAKASIEDMYSPYVGKQKSRAIFFKTNRDKELAQTILALMQ